MNGVITVNGVEYEPVEKKTGKRHIVVLDRGWIFVGDLEHHEDGHYKLSRASNIRLWKRSGFGGMTRDPKAAGAEMDACVDQTFDHYIFAVPVADEWGE